MNMRKARNIKLGRPMHNSTNVRGPYSKNLRYLIKFLKNLILKLMRVNKSRGAMVIFSQSMTLSLLMKI